MAITTLDRTTWTQIASGSSRLQVFGGRILVADTATPAAGDHHTYPTGAVFDVASPKYAQALDTTPTWVVALAL